MLPVRVIGVVVHVVDLSRVVPELFASLIRF